MNKKALYINMSKIKLINSKLKTVQCVFPTACGNSVLYLTKEPVGICQFSYVKAKLKQTDVHFRRIAAVEGL